MDLTSINTEPIAIPEQGINWGDSYLWNWKGFKCHWRVLGPEDCQPILLIHGFGASSAHWRNNAYTLAKSGFRVYGLDLIGFGESEQPSPRKIKKLDNGFWAKQISGFLDEVIETNKHGKAILIGNSLGSLAALTTIIFSPDKVSGLVASPLPDPALMQTYFLSEANYIKKIFNIIIIIFFSVLPLELLIPLIAKTPLINLSLQFAYQKSIKSDIELKHLVSKPALRPTAPQALRAMCIGMTCRSRELTAPFLLKKLEKMSNNYPILLLWGRNDRLVPLEIGKKLLADYPWLSLYVIDESGHCPHDESPFEFNRTVLNWLSINLQKESQA